MNCSLIIINWFALCKCDQLGIGLRDKHFSYFFSYFYSEQNSSTYKLTRGNLTRPGGLRGRLGGRLGDGLQTGHGRGLVVKLMSSSGQVWSRSGSCYSSNLILLSFIELDSVRRTNFLTRFLIPPSRALQTLITVFSCLFSRQVYWNYKNDLEIFRKLFGQVCPLSVFWAEPDPPEEPVHPETGDCEQPARVRAGVHQREAVQVSVLQLHVSRDNLPLPKYFEVNVKNIQNVFGCIKCHFQHFSYYISLEKLQIKKSATNLFI